MNDLFFNIPARIYFGFDSTKKAGILSSRLGTRALLVTETILSEKGIPEGIQGILNKIGIECIIFNEINPKSTSRAVEDAVSLAKGSHAQIVIGLGGVRALSTAKCTAGLAACSITVDDLLDGISADSKPLNYIEIPTTCRNPFMLTDKCLIVDSRNRTAGIFSIQDNYANTVIIDSGLTASLSDKYIVSTLLDTFLSAIEGYFSLKSNFVSDSIFLKSIATVISMLQTMTDDPENPELKTKGSQAGLLAALGLSMSSPGIGSGVSYVINGRFMAPKSWIASIMIPHILEYSLTVCPEKVSRMAPILGETTEGLSTVEAAKSVGINAAKNRRQANTYASA